MVALIVAVLLITILVYCNRDKEEIIQPPIVVKTEYTYTEEEILTLDSINNYRVGAGLTLLEKDGFVSIKCEEHNNNMIAQDSLSHNGYVERETEIVRALGATNVGENVGYGFSTAKGVVDAWIASPTHKKNLDGDYTNFGISIRKDSTGKRYYTNIFYKK